MIALTILPQLVKALWSSYVFRYVLAFVVIVVALYASHSLTYNSGYKAGADDKDSEYQEVIRQERIRQAQVNQEALEAAKVKELHLERQIRERDAEIARILDEARKDPTSDRPAISVGGVRRLNRIK